MKRLIFFIKKTCSCNKPLTPLDRAFLSSNHLILGISNLWRVIKAKLIGNPFMIVPHIQGEKQKEPNFILLVMTTSSRGKDAVCQHCWFSKCNETEICCNIYFSTVNILKILISCANATFWNNISSSPAHIRIETFFLVSYIF